MKGIIIAAGYGTRFLPATKTVPKEMFPLIDTPAIDFIVDEFIDSGIKDILVVSSRRKKSLEDYFDREVELETVFKKENDEKKLEKIRSKDANFYFVKQKEMLGTGHAILICKNFIGNDPFVIAYPDDLVFSKNPLTKQLIDIYEKTGGSVLSGEEIDGDVSRYGVLDYVKENSLLKMKRIVEKPKKGEEPSKTISVGRYLFTPELLSILEENFKKHKGGEFYHIDAINNLASQGKVYVCSFEGERVDVGDKLGYLEGIIKYALTRDDMKDDVKNILKKYCNN
ncbi:MAG TPA: UTP--glucose-1-phosphate uridylyltransferase [Spirochaetota bacterium]|nr:UTP--glucose-1-phosphate uridylyltransferase [Spirochaetota bacterium]